MGLASLCCVVSPSLMTQRRSLYWGALMMRGSTVVTFLMLCTDSSHAPPCTNLAVMTHLGLQAGRIIVHHKHDSHGALLKRWLTWGVLLCVLATALCGGAKHGGAMPINKVCPHPRSLA